jgi:putative ABC transport system permease protein
MRLLRAWAHRVAGLFHKDRRDREFSAELDSHLQHHMEDNLSRGLSPAEARHEALVALGGLEAVKEAHRDRRGLPFLETFAQDVHFGLRMLGKSPGMTFVAVATLALGIGATTALFSVVNAALLRSLPYPHADRLMILRETIPSGGYGSVAYPNYLDWKAQSRSFDTLAAYSSTIYTLQAGAQTDRVNGELVTSEYLSLLGGRAIQGRLFLPAETVTPGANPILLISYGLWQRKFGGDPAVIGRSVRVNETPFTIIGVLSPAFLGLSGTAEAWAPITMYNQLFPQLAAYDFLHNRDTHWHRVLGLLKPGVTFEQARAEMKQIGDRLAAAYPKENEGRSGGVYRLTDVLQGRLRTPLWLLLGAVGFLLLIACANVANLLLTRLVSRERELAVRAALGAGRRRLLQQLSTESLVLALLGGLAGVTLAVAARHTLAAALPVELPAFVGVRTDPTVLIFSVFLTLVAALLVGLAPARRAAGSHAETALRAGGRSHSSRGTRRLGGVLAVCQIALAMVLLAGAGLLVRTLWAMHRIDLGFRPDHLALLRFDVPNQGYSGEKRLRLGEELADAVRTLPGVESAAITYMDPFEWSGITRGFTIEGQATVRGDAENDFYEEVGPGFFHALGAPLVQGREFTPLDSATAPHVAIVSQAFAKRFWPGHSPIGKRMKLGALDFHLPWMTVVGVAGDIQFDSLQGDRSTPVYYVPCLQSEVVIGLDLIVRTAGAPEAMLPAIRDRIHRFDANLPVYNLTTMDDRLGGEMASTRSFVLLLAFFSASALLLAALGVYGVLAAGVGERIRELGVRRALGAQPADVLRLVLRHGILLTLAGAAAGILAALALARFLRTLLYGVTTTDPLAFLAAAALLATVALLACLLPAWRATRVDPLVALRYE